MTRNYVYLQRLYVNELQAHIEREEQNFIHECYSINHSLLSKKLNIGGSATTNLTLPNSFNNIERLNDLQSHT